MKFTRNYLIQNFLILITIWNCICNHQSKIYDEKNCNDETFKPNCGSNAVLIIKKALYGRMERGKCATTDQQIGCQKDVSDRLQKLCSGATSCLVDVSAKNMEMVNPCGEIISYLQVLYYCQEVFVPKEKPCQNCNSIKLLSTSGYLSSNKTFQPKCGNSNCLFEIVGKEGQTIELTLIDFNYVQDQYIGDNCETYAIIKEKFSRKPICAVADTKNSAIYRSEDHAVNIQMKTSPNLNFLLHFNVVGCPDMKILYADMFRKNNTTVVKCRNSELQYNLECIDSKWIDGENTTCPDKTERERSKPVLAQLLGIQTEILVVLIICVSFLMISCTFTLCLCCFKRRCNSGHRQYNPNETDSKHFETYGQSFPEPTYISRDYTVRDYTPKDYTSRNYNIVYTHRPEYEDVEEVNWPSGEYY